LIAAAWRDPVGPDRKALDVHITSLRASIEVDTHRPARLPTVRGSATSSPTPAKR